MSIEIIFHPKHPPRSELKKLLIELGFRQAKHLWKWSKGSLHFHWFSEEDYQSLDGVETVLTSLLSRAGENLQSQLKLLLRPGIQTHLP